MERYGITLEQLVGLYVQQKMSEETSRIWLSLVLDLPDWLSASPLGENSQPARLSSSEAGPESS